MKGAIRSGISIKLDMIMGFPQETRKDIFKTLRFLAEMAWLGVDDVTVATFVPYPRSALFDRLCQSGCLPKLDDGFYYGLVSYGDAKNVNSFSEHLSSRALLVFRLGSMLLF